MVDVPGLKIRSLKSTDARVISDAFAVIGWNKTVEQFERYFNDQTQRATGGVRRARRFGICRVCDSGVGVDVQPVC